MRLDAAKVILAVRSIKKGEDAKANIEATTNRKNVVEVWQVDMSSYKSIIDFAKKCESLDRVDVLLANAGVLRNTFEEAEGTEITIAVNVIGTFLLVLNFLPILRRSRQKTGNTPRVTITSSVLHDKVCLLNHWENCREADKWSQNLLNDTNPRFSTLSKKIGRTTSQIDITPPNFSKSSLCVQLLRLWRLDHMLRNP